MPPSQLKRLKSSLREQGIVGDQKSKKKKSQAKKSGLLRESRTQKNAALQEIRERFNPFEIQRPSKSKYEFARNTAGKSAISRPGVTKSLGEEGVGLITDLCNNKAADDRCSVGKHSSSKCRERRRWEALRTVDLARMTLQ